MRVITAIFVVLAVIFSSSTIDNKVNNGENFTNSTNAINNTSTATHLVNQFNQESPANFPTALIIGEQPNIFETLNREYTTQLLTVCKDDLNKAYAEWQHVLYNFEVYAQQEGFSLDGVKLWIKFYWSKKGMIEHVAFDLKHQSKRVSREMLTDLFEGFIKDYQRPTLTASSKFAHYGSVSYPIYANPVYAD